MFATVILAVVAFFFPVMQIYDHFGWEVSNLGPIATFFWGIAIDIWVITPVFIFLAITKRIRSSSHAQA